MKRALLTAIIVALSGIPQLNAAPEDQEIFTDFEAFDTGVDQPFVVGAAPSAATFSGNAFSGIAGIGELYFSGVRAWMVNPGGIGTIEFDTNASIVEFWTRLRTGANGSSEYTTFDDADEIIDSVTITTPGPFQLLSFSGNIARIEIQNNAVGGNLMNSIEDFGFTTIAAQILVGDYNENGSVDAPDYNVWRDTFGSDTELAADGNLNGVVDAPDYNVWRDNFGNTIGEPVPEPSSMVLAFISAVFATLINRRVWR